MRSRIAFVAFVALSLSAIVANAATHADYSETPDEFGSGTQRVVTMATDDTAFVGLNLVCRGDGPLLLQLVVRDTLFPSSLDHDSGVMLLPVTMKVDTAPEAIRRDWNMPLGQYENAMFPGDVDALVDQMLKGDRLSLRVERGAQVYRFDLKEARPHIRPWISACR